MGKHAVDRYLDFVRHVAGKSGAACLAAPPEFRIAVGEKEKRSAAALLNEHAASLPSSGEGKGLHKDAPRFVAVNPVAFWETKLWGEEKFAELCDRLREELGIGIVLTGGESAPLERICRKMRTKAVNLGGRTTLRELACIYREAALLVTTDSGPMHLAAAAGTPVVALFGPTDPARTGPYGPGHRIIRKGLSCSPCFRKRCETPRCMTDISVEEVFTAVKEMLAGRE
jgi:3-deoxy-D-manno-octulosonic-acid transferase/heptosyltransferase-1